MLAENRFLGRLNLPGDLKKLSPSQQDILCWELRSQLLLTVSENGGHLASNLCVVELTVALHTVFDIPRDEIVWDVGHQCYVHKILTGRLKQFSEIRREGGLSGFPRPRESRSDAFIAGHASTSLSAACGLAKAKTLTGDPHHVIAVAGDGAFTGGMIYEALNNAGRSRDHLIVILNDNDMSISKSVGSFARYLAAKRSSERYNVIKEHVEKAVRKIPLVGGELRNVISDSKAALRQMLYHSNLFEDFGFDYLGPVDGHDVRMLIQVLRRAKELKKPVVVHVNTIKGKGYAYAEKNPSHYHGVGGFDPVSGQLSVPAESFSAHFGSWLTMRARRDERICAITAAMRDGTGLEAFAEEFGPKNRFFDVGIAEEHAVTFACGLAAGGLLPVFAVYSTFLQRAYDQLIHDASIEPQHIVLAVDRAGFVGEDGETHQGLFDAAFLSSIYGMTVYSPASYAELEYAMERALYHCKGPVAVRYPRGGASASEADHVPDDWLHIKNGGKTLLISYGRIFSEVRAAAKLLAESKKPVDLLKLCRIAPLPEECIRLARKYETIYFVEEGVRNGGIGEHFLGALAQVRYRGRMTIHAVDNPFVPQMSVQSAIRRCGFDAKAIAKAVAELYF